MNSLDLKVKALTTTLIAELAAFCDAQEGSVSITLQGTVNVKAPPPQVIGVTSSESGGMAVIDSSATPNAATPSVIADSFSASIDWGDGSTSNGTVVDEGDGSFNVNGSHSYQKKGKYTVTVTIRDPGGSITSATTLIAVGSVKPKQ